MDENNFFYYPGVGNKENKIYTPDELYHCILARISAGYPAICSIPSLREYAAENEELCQSEQYIKEKLQKGEIKKYKKELIIAQRETFNYIDFDKISRGNLIKAYVSMTNNSLKNFTQAYGPFHTIVEAHTFKTRYEDAVFKYEKKIAYYDFLLDTIQRGFGKYMENLEIVEKYWFHECGPPLCQISLEIFEKGFDAITDKIIAYEEKIDLLNKNLYICDYRRNQGFNVLCKKYPYEMRHVEPIWMKELREGSLVD